MKILNLLLKLLFAGVLAYPLSSFAQVGEKRPVQWAGLSLAGDFIQLPKLMPTVYELVTLDQDFLKQLTGRLARIVTESASAHPSLQILVEDQLRQGDDSYALTFALAGESVTGYAIENTTFVDYVIQALVLVANVSKDPSKQRIVTSYPVQVKYQNAYPDGKKPGDKDRRDIFRRMLMGEAGKADVVVEWQKRLSEIRLREKEVWISVAPLVISPEAQQQGGFTKDQADGIAFKVSSVVEGNISRATDIPIVPTTLDGALDQLTLSFANRGIVAFRKPDPSYVFQVNVFALGSRALEEAMTREKKFAVAYGGGFEIEYFSIDPDRNRAKEFGMRLQSVQSVSYLGTSKDTQRASSADMFARLISAFADELSSNLIPANARWIEKNKASTEQRSPQELAKMVTEKLPSAKRMN